MIESKKINDKYLEALIVSIENSPPQAITKRSEADTFELWSDPAILEQLSGNIGAIFVRSLLNRLNVDEHHVFKWRLENKYRQYQILNHYVPDSVAESMGLSALLNTTDGVQKIRELCADGFFIKATLGHRTGENKNFDRTADLENIILSHQKESDQTEKWMVQKRLNLKEEFRLHTFSKKVIYGLTFIMKGEDSLKGAYAEEFVKGILEKLPETISQGTLIGWDIGITDNNEYYVIETNVTGFHPEYARGFQTSGYFGDTEFGSIMCAWLNHYFSLNYQVSIDSVENSLLSSNPFYQEFMYYAALFKKEQLEFLRNQVKATNIAGILYLGEQINPLLTNLLTYFQIENFADTYYLIVNGKNAPMLRQFFSGHADVMILTENDLFTADQYQLIEQLSYERRKKICSYRALRRIPEMAIFML
ncbi:hypothetical protein [Pedobacter gandavensis]|uniref:hypothetical protein n=1 Tax=Pedobacter gandavensis TaxID=2679963 RepID=UPI00293052A1|nr:hypothetical protein [Pedobacter gandavensis]